MRPGGCASAAEKISPVPASVTAYCRQARRLRGTFGRQPAQMHRKLRELAAARGAGQPAETIAVPAAQAHVGESTARGFAERVALAMEGPVLRYTARRALLREARGLGIGAFEANLVIAAVQHERRKAGDAAARPGPQVWGKRLSFIAPALVVVVAELLVALRVWQVCFG